jgi:magnesium transporter
MPPSEINSPEQMGSAAASGNSPAPASPPPPEDDEDDEVFLQDADIGLIREALDAEDSATVEKLLLELSPAEAAEVLAKLHDDARETLVHNYVGLFDPEVFVHLDDTLRADLLSIMTPQAVARIVTELDSDDALDLILPLDKEQQQSIIKYLSAKTRLTLEEGLRYPDSSAGRLMQREFVAVPQFWTVGKTLEYFRAATDELPSEFSDIILISPGYHVVGEVPLYELVKAKRSTKLGDLDLLDVPIIPATMDQEEVAHLFRREGFRSAPVVDDDNRLVGVITIDDVLDVIDEEASEDILKLGGVGEGDLHRDVYDTTKSRFKWLFVNLLTAILASWVVSFFEATIEQIVALAVLMPVVASMGGNAGTQSLTVAVRALATKELSSTNMMRVIGKETLVGLLNGLAFAVLAGIVTALWFASPGLGLVIALAMIINLIVAGFCGAGIPILLQKIGADPAISSAVFLTTVTDVLGFFAFLGLAALFLG